MKNTNILKRLAASVLCVILMLSFCTIAFANDTLSNGVKRNASSTSIDFVKEIVIYNDEAVTVQVPTITYNYSIAPATVTSLTVTDENGNTVAVNNGVTGGMSLTDSTAVFPQAGTTTVTASSSGTKVSDTLTATVDLSRFTKAGIYRYVVTEADATSAMTTAGMTRPSGYSTTRYLDLYIKNGASGLEVSGYTMFIGNDIIDADDATNNAITGKTSGFVDDVDTSDLTGSTTDSPSNADAYYTYNITVAKSITGDLADKTHAFNFVLATDTAVANTAFNTSILTNTSGNATVAATGAIGTNVSFSLADGDVAKFTGLPANTKFNVTETNNTSDTYTVSVSDATAGTLQTDVVTAAAATISANAATTAISTYTTSTAAAPTASYSALTFVNELTSVSPTGVVLRIAPYLTILGLGIALIAGMKRREEENTQLEAI